MKTIEKSFSPSVNIIRDSDKELNYVVTKNSIRVASQILSDYRNQIHSFSIIGSYGTGKSSFIWAFEKNLKKEKDYFFNLNGEFEKVRFINIVGSYSPIEELLHKALGLRTEPTMTNVLEGLQRVYSKSRKANELLVIVIDEFGKVLEYAAQQNPEERMFFIQQFAEFVNNPAHSIILINTLHQNFNAYSSRLRTEQKQEWNKVRGRFVELTFNEPVEQLLFLAADQIKQWNIFGTERLNSEEKNRAIIESGLLPISSDFAEKLTLNLLPLDVISASILTQILKDYGQNERSLFTFLAMRNEDSLYAYAEGQKRFDLSALYDYVLSNFYSHIDDKHNRDKNKWDRVKISLDRIHNHLKEDIELAYNIVKAIGLISIYGNKGGKLNDRFLIEYFGSKKVTTVLEKLVELRIVLYRKHLSSYSLTEGTDLDYYEAIENAASKIDQTVNIVGYLNKYYSLPYLNAKKISYENGTPRFFEFIITDELVDEQAIGEIDGRIYLIFNPNFTQQDFKEFSRKATNANVYVRYKNTKDLTSTIVEIQKVEYVLERIENDKVAEDELNKIYESLRSQLNNDILDDIYSSSKHREWYFKGIRKEISSQRSINGLLSEVIKSTYTHTPIIKNELINKHKISSAISTARKQYVKALLNNSQIEDLGFEKTKFPPEKTIYESLLKNTGLHGSIEKDVYGFKNQIDKRILNLWNLCEVFLRESINEQKSLSELISVLKAPPYKLKDGLINFWIPTFLILRNNEYALFKDGNYIPFLSTDLFDLIYKDPKAFNIRAYPFGGIETKVFNQYRNLFNIPQDIEITNQSVIETIKPFLLFYKGLPTHAKLTEHHLSHSAREFRSAIANAKDPYTAFFETFPKSLGYDKINLKENSTALDNYVVSLKKAINELRGAYNELLARFEKFMQKTTSMNDLDGLRLKEELEKRFTNIDIDRISPIHRKVLSRIRVPIEDKALWFESIAMAILEKPLRDATDEDEEVLYKSFQSLYSDLVDIIPLHDNSFNINAPGEKIVGIKMVMQDGQSKGFQAILNDDLSISEELLEHFKSKVKAFDDHKRKAISIELIKGIIDGQS